MLFLSSLATRQGFDPDSVTPGVVGFAATALIAIAVCLLLWDMNRRVRRVRYREEVRAEIAAEQEAAVHVEGARFEDAPGGDAQIEEAQIVDEDAVATSAESHDEATGTPRA